MLLYRNVMSNVIIILYFLVFVIVYHMKLLMLEASAHLQNKYPVKMASGGVPRIRYACDTDKSVLVNNFDKRGWVSVSSDDDWNFYWYGVHFLFMKK